MRLVTPIMECIPFSVDSRPMRGAYTSFAGLSTVFSLFRALRVPEACDLNLGIKVRDRGFAPSMFLESLCLLHASGGDCMTDMQRLRDDEGLTRMLDYRVPSPRSIGDFLEAFHDGDAVEKAEKKARAEKRLAFIPEENTPLKGLAAVRQQMIQTIAATDDFPTIATVDMDATIIESAKSECTWTYEGVKGYQPMVALWAEADLILADEFRQGNVPAMMDPLTCTKEAFRALPEEVTERYFRGDSACHENNLLAWLRDESREDGPKGFIGFAVSARMSIALRTALESVPETEWTTIEKEHDGTLRQWADLDFTPGEPSEHKGTAPFRYIGIRIKKAQGYLFADGGEIHYHAIITNRNDFSGDKLVAWQREKAGTIEHAHEDMKNGLGAGRLPSGKFGANAAWFRIASIAYNLLSVLRMRWPDEELKNAKPKRLRYALFSFPGRVVRDARTNSLRIAASEAFIKNLIAFIKGLDIIIRPTG